MHRREQHFWIILGLLAAWKIARTDWVVTAPYWFGDPAKTSPGGLHTTYDISPPVHPLWDPPIPSDVEVGAKDWDSLYPGGGAGGITGPPVLKPNYLRMGIETLGAFIILFPLSLGLRRPEEPEPDLDEKLYSGSQ